MGPFININLRLNNKLLFGPSCSPKSHENLHYRPYISLCNRALQCMVNLDENHFRKPSDLDIRFAHCDPKIVKASYKDTEVVDRKPDVCITSLNAAQHVAGTSDFTGIPKTSFIWPQVLQANELKLRQRDLHRVFDNIGEGFSDTARQVTIDYTSSDEKLNFVFLPGSEPTSKKRDLEEDTDSERPIKMRSAGNSKIYAIPDVPTQKTESKSKETLSARAQCASYALEMLSHCLGVHHAINLLIIGMSFPVA